jgi:prepilin-type N-terminal cleavage/methylation domain-containing protein
MLNPPLASRPLPLRRSRSGFTMIELLVVIAIIGIISGILVLGLKSVAGDRQRDQTRGMLKRLDNAMTEITTTPAGAFKMYSIQLPNIYFPIDPSDPSNRYQNSAYQSWIGVPAAAIESQVRTALVLKQIVSTNPSGKKFLDDLPPERKKLVKWTTTVPGSDNLKPTPADRPQYTMPLDAWGNPILFVFDGLLIPTGTNVGRPFTVNVGGGAETYVGGLTNLGVVSDKSYYTPLNALTPLPTYPTAATTDSPNALNNAAWATPAAPFIRHKSVTAQDEYTLRSPDHKPFWVSAGPDGRYDTHDDNVYSFGN